MAKLPRAGWPHCSLHRLSGSGLAGVDAADLVPGQVEAPEGGHLSPGVVAVPGEEIEPVFFFTLDVHVTMRGEDLAVDPVAE